MEVGLRLQDTQLYPRNTPRKSRHIQRFLRDERNCYDLCFSGRPKIPKSLVCVKSCIEAWLRVIWYLVWMLNVLMLFRVICGVLIVLNSLVCCLLIAAINQSISQSSNCIIELCDYIDSAVCDRCATWSQNKNTFIVFCALFPAGLWPQCLER